MTHAALNVSRASVVFSRWGLSRDAEAFLNDLLAFLSFLFVLLAFIARAMAIANSEHDTTAVIAEKMTRGICSTSKLGGLCFLAGVDIARFLSGRCAASANLHQSSRGPIKAVLTSSQSRFLRSLFPDVISRRGSR